MKEDLLNVNNLKTYFYGDNEVTKAVDDVSFSIKKGETVCIVGESGCGKSVTSLSIMGLINDPGRIVAGEILYNETDLLKLSKNDFQNLRGKEISMIFQEPMTSLNPVFTIGSQLIEILLEHELINKKEAYKKAIELINTVGIPRAEDIIKAYPHQLSGGMIQRIMIAIALSSNPKLLIADEPTTALDVTIQAQILDLLQKLKLELNTSILFITHDLGVVAEIADYVIVMYAGKIVEEAPVVELFKNPMHPYTKGLLNSRPIIGQHNDRLYPIKGSVPDLSKLNESCYFNERCEYCKDICRKKSPNVTLNHGNHKTACWLYEKGDINE
ncbi:ABC transporter ATP-binding protein [Clostridium felsineum]|uniref:Dipeptide transport ATP-binding protein DppD n=1 Tax=Clostridium felsineum TaxID=36839 RepID=A0A1S8KXP7_9CLOT|nr:ABC transporter ATP-binding protein [Clostridium felsineum]URZ08272.1 Dipeptide transport ATP-binding protein DppD [Clostridium felsineum]URZ13303.1 Dipeptide transport ATP-binding protein DppD [Clostridium felsineum]